MKMVRCANSIWYRRCSLLCRLVLKLAIPSTCEDSKSSWEAQGRWAADAPLGHLWLKTDPAAEMHELVHRHRQTRTMLFLYGWRTSRVKHAVECATSSRWSDSKVVWNLHLDLIPRHPLQTCSSLFLPPRVRHTELTIQVPSRVGDIAHVAALSFRSAHRPLFAAAALSTPCHHFGVLLAWGTTKAECEMFHRQKTMMISERQVEAQAPAWP